MGGYRFLLALLVVASHFFDGADTFYLGPYAVYCFMIISGYVMTLLVTRYYDAVNLVPNFYLDRAFRILPQFICYVALTYFFVTNVQTGLQPVGGAGFDGCRPSMLGMNALILFNFLVGIPIADCLLLPQAWSLGLETAFYLLIPFILVSMGTASFWVVFAGSFIVFTKSLIGQIDYNEWSYFNLPGTLFIFLIGVILARFQGLSRCSKVAMVFSVLALGLIVIASATGITRPGYRLEAMCAIATTPILLSLLAGLKPSRLDNLLGDLSYGIFLNHVLVIYFVEWVLGTLGILLDKNLLNYLAIVVLASGAAFLSYATIERPFIQLRRRGRHRQALNVV